MQSFDERVTNSFAGMRPAEQRAAKFFQENREEVLIGSAAALALKAKTSDATIMRTTRALGFTGLDDMRRALASELRGSLSPAARLTNTLGKVGRDPSAAFDTMLEVHLQSLESLRRTISAELFDKAVATIIGAKRILVFGLGPSSAIASYFVIQLARFGFDAAGLANTGLLFADDLQRVRKGDLVVILAYSRVYQELAVLVDEVQRRNARSLLLTDTLAAKLRERVDLVLPVARGQADMLSTHTATLGLLEALLVGVASRRPAETLASLENLNESRRKLAGKAVKLSTAIGRKPES
jgi:DNA-binding MurR/RpiR family transcriptional regulator